MKHKSRCFWLTGLSGSGKTTLSNTLKAKLDNVVVLDGDVIREVLGMNFAHDRASRLKLAYIYARMAKMLVEHQVNVICSTISLFHEVQDWNRQNIPNYIEVFLDTDRMELERRDSKQIYSQARSGILTNVVGVDIEPEFPRNPEFRIKNEEDIQHFLRAL
jgi:adenylylsulfate kinase-like enzyme